MARKAVLLALAAVIGTGCAGRIPFTASLKDQYSLKPEDVKNLQFFISHLVILERRVASQDQAVSQNHKLVVRSGQKIEQVAILAGTPGVVEDMAGDEIHVSFEQGTRLHFRANAALGGRYDLICDPPQPGGTVQLHAAAGPVEFKAIGESCKAHLMIDKARMDQYEHRISIQKGRTLD